MERTFTNLDTRTASIFEAIQAGVVSPNSDAVNELAELLIVAEDAPVKPTVVARLTVVRQNGWRTIVEVRSNASFHSFFLYFKQYGKKRSTKELIRTANRNDGGVRQPRLENIAEKLSVYQSQSNPVIKTTIHILKKRAYKRLITARPDELGLTRSTARRQTSLFSSRTSMRPS